MLLKKENNISTSPKKVLLTLWLAPHYTELQQICICCCFISAQVSILSWMVFLHVMLYSSKKEYNILLQSATLQQSFSPTMVGHSVASSDRQRAAYVAQFPCLRSPKPSAFSPLRLSIASLPNPFSSSSQLESVVSLLHSGVCWEEDVGMRLDALAGKSSTGVARQNAMQKYKQSTSKLSIEASIFCQQMSIFFFILICPGKEESSLSGATPKF